MPLPSDPPLQWSRGSTRRTERGYWWRYDVGLTPNPAVCSNTGAWSESENAPRVLHFETIQSRNVHVTLMIMIGGPKENTTFLRKVT